MANAHQRIQTPNHSQQRSRSAGLRREKRCRRRPQSPRAPGGVQAAKISKPAGAKLPFSKRRKCSCRVRSAERQGSSWGWSAANTSCQKLTTKDSSCTLPLLTNNWPLFSERALATPSSPPGRHPPDRRSAAGHNNAGPAGLTAASPKRRACPAPPWPVQPGQ